MWVYFPLESNEAFTGRESHHSWLATVNARTWLTWQLWPLALRPSSDLDFSGFLPGPVLHLSNLPAWLFGCLAVLLLGCQRFPWLVTGWPQGSPLISNPLAQLSSFSGKDTPGLPCLSATHILFQFRFQLPVAESEIMTASHGDAFCLDSFQ